MTAVSPDMLEECIAVISRFDITGQELEEFAVLFLNPGKSMFVIPRKRAALIKKDTTDNIFLECALAAKADFIISGDKHLLELGTFMKTDIVTAAEFVRRV